MLGGRFAFLKCAEKYWNNLESIEEKFKEHREITDSASLSWITYYVNSLDLTHRKKVKLTLEFYFIHWLRTSFEDDIHKLWRSISSRSTILGHVDITIIFLDKCTVALSNYTKISSYFDHLKLYSFDDLIPAQLEHKSSIEFHAEIAFCTQMWYLAFVR